LPRSIRRTMQSAKLLEIFLEIFYSVAWCGEAAPAFRLKSVFGLSTCAASPHSVLLSFFFFFENYTIIFLIFYIKLHQHMVRRSRTSFQANQSFDLSTYAASPHKLTIKN
jgi:hypothetical protein